MSDQLMAGAAVAGADLDPAGGGANVAVPEAANPMPGAPTSLAEYIGLSAGPKSHSSRRVKPHQVSKVNETYISA